MNNNEEDLKKVKNVYYLYIAGPITLYITSMIGYMTALRQRNKFENSIIVNNHYSYQFKIMNINMILNLIILLTALAYTFNIISEIDFSSLDIESFTVKLTDVFQFYLLGSILVNVLLFAQSLKGIYKINNNTYV